MLDEGFKSSSQVGGFPHNGDGLGMDSGWTVSMSCHGVWSLVACCFGRYFVEISWRDHFLQLQSPLDISLVICLPFLDTIGSDHFC